MKRPFADKRPFAPFISFDVISRLGRRASKPTARTIERLYEEALEERPIEVGDEPNIFVHTEGTPGAREDFPEEMREETTPEELSERLIADDVEKRIVQSSVYRTRAATIYYVVARTFDDPATQEEVAELFDVSAATISNHLPEVARYVEDNYADVRYKRNTFTGGPRG